MLMMMPFFEDVGLELPGAMHMHALLNVEI